MTLHPHSIGPVPEETARIAHAACPKGNPYLHMRDLLGTLYDDQLFAALFPPQGQPALAHAKETVETAETAKEQEHTSKTANCTFSGELVPIDIKRFTDSGINLVECPRCGRMRSLSSSKGVLRFKAHTRRKQQTPLTEKRWSSSGKTDWDVVGGK